MGRCQPAAADDFHPPTGSEGVTAEWRNITGAVEVVLPADVVVAARLEAGAVSRVCPVLETPPDQMILDVGPKAVAHYIDVVGRYGGEEFLILMPNTDGIQATVLAERIRRVTEETTFSFRDAQVRFTVSAGIARNTVDSGEVRRSEGE